MKLPITIALFNSKFDNAVDKLSNTDWFTWAPNFVAAFQRDGAPTVEEKDELLGAVFGEWDTSDTARRRPDGKVQRVQDNFKSFHVLTLDVEQTDEANPVSLTEVLDTIDGLEYVGYTTFSHLLPGKGERYRILLPLKTPMPTSMLERLARSTDKQGVWVGALPTLFPFVDHKATWKRLQIAYLPGATDPSNFEIWHQHGEVFDWEALDLLAPLPKFSAPDTRNASRENTGRPLLHTMDLFEWFSDYGLIKNGERGDHPVQVSCPNRGAHTGGIDDGAALLLNREDGRYGFYCQHSHCSHLAGANFMKHVQEHDPQWADYCDKKPDYGDLATQLKQIRESRRACK